jgi:hypothetical protein
MFSRPTECSGIKLNISFKDNFYFNVIYILTKKIAMQMIACRLVGDNNTRNLEVTT